MYGPIRPISENLKHIGLIPSKPSAAPQAKPVVTESKVTPKPVEKPAAKPAPKAAAPVQKKDRLAVLLEQVETLSSEMKTTFAEQPSKKIRNVTESLAHVQKVSSAVVKKYEWRTGEREKSVTELFKALGTLAEGLGKQITAGELTEESKIRSDANELIKRFVKAVGVVKEDLGINPEVFQDLVKESSKL